MCTIYVSATALLLFFCLLGIRLHTLSLEIDLNASVLLNGIRSVMIYLILRHVIQIQIQLNFSFMQL